MNKGGLSCCEPSAVEQVRPDGKRRFRDSCRGRKVHASGYRQALGRRGDRVLGVTTARDERTDSISTLPAANVRANRAAVEALAPGAADRLLHYFEVANAGWGYTTRQYAVTAVRGRAATGGGHG